MKITQKRSSQPLIRAVADLESRDARARSDESRNGKVTYSAQNLNIPNFLIGCWLLLFKDLPDDENA